MKTDPGATEPTLTVRVLLRVNQICDDFEAEYRAGQTPRLEAFVTRAQADAGTLLEHLIPIDIAYRRRRGERPSSDEYLRRFPALDSKRLGRLFTDPAEVLFPPALGEYDLVRRIGAGGMGVVYLARHRRMNREVALKAVPPTAPERELLQERFAREVEITATLTHPNIVTAFDAREDEGVCYLVTAYLEGGDLGRLVRRCGPLPVARAVRAVRDAALGLAHAHAHGVVHRDVKPSNLLVDSRGRVCVADWGLAKTAATSPTARKLTAAGVTLGTVDYLAPELAGQAERADTRSDVYSLGCVLYFLLVGRPPFARGDIVERLNAHRAATVPNVAISRPEVPAPLAALVSRMLAKNPADRPQEMDAVVAALAESVESPARRKLTRRALIGVGAAAVLLPAAAVVGRRVFWPDSPPAPPLPVEKPQPVIAEMPFNDPRAYQRLWAEHLGVPVERVDTIAGVDFRFVLVPPGRFRMGSPDDLIARALAQPNLDDWRRRLVAAEKERPVTITRPFYLAKTEVTFAQFGLFVDRRNYRTFTELGAPGWGYHGREEGWKMAQGYNWKSVEQYHPAASHPVVNVSWTDALAFCAWLSTAIGGACRLPAESEWEFACRGGRYGLWGHGDTATDLLAFAVYAVELPAPVGTRKPNAYGLHDMHGNVAEMCEIEDRYTDDPAKPTPKDNAMHPVRGGRFNELLPEAIDAWPGPYRCARRLWEPRESLTAGFRVLREIPV